MNDLSEEDTKKEKGLMFTIKSIGCFFKNRNILVLICYLMTVQFGLHCVDIPAGIILLNKGFSRSTLATIELCLIPLN